MQMIEISEVELRPRRGPVTPLPTIGSLFYKPLCYPLCDEVWVACIHREVVFGAV